MSFFSTNVRQFTHNGYKRFALLVLLVTIIVGGTQIPAAAQRLRGQTTSNSADTTARLATSNTTPGSNDASFASAAVQTPAATEPANPQSCAPIRYIRPNAIDLTTANTGLSLIVDSPQQYFVNGSSLSQIRAALSVCAPEVDGSTGFLAYTDYAVNWSYGVTRLPSGVCTITNPKVGMHVAQILPALAGKHNGDAVEAAWNQFSTNLTTHESGHVAYDTQYAKQLLQDITNMPATDCGKIAELTNAVIRQDLAELSIANENYDSDTNHGDSQGAHLR